MTSWALATDVLADQRGAGDGGDGYGHDLDVDARVMGLRLGATDRGDLRVGEHDLRDGAVVGPRRPVLARQDVTDEPRLVLALMGEQRPAVDVTGGVQPVAVDAGDTQLVVDLERSAGLEADGVEPDVVGVEGPAGGDEQLVARRARCRRPGEGDRAVGAVPPCAFAATAPVRTAMPSAVSASVSSSLTHGS
jgi:hypothetical protein